MGEFEKLLEYLKGMEARNIAKKEFSLLHVKIVVNYTNREEHIFSFRNVRCEVNGGCNSWIITFIKEKSNINFRVTPGQSKIRGKALEIQYDQNHSVLISVS